jgi:transcription elongation factor Elf1
MTPDDPPRRSWIDHSVTPPPQQYTPPSIVCPYCGHSTQIVTTVRYGADRAVTVECVNPLCERNTPPDGAA